MSELSSRWKRVWRAVMLVMTLRAAWTSLTGPGVALLVDGRFVVVNLAALLQAVLLASDILFIYAMEVSDRRFREQRDQMARAQAFLDEFWMVVQKNEEGRHE